MYVCIKEYIYIIIVKKICQKVASLFITRAQLLYAKYIHIHRYTVVK